MSPRCPICGERGIPTWRYFQIVERHCWRCPHGHCEFQRAATPYLILFAVMLFTIGGPLIGFFLGFKRLLTENMGGIYFFAGLCMIAHVLLDWRWPPVVTRYGPDLCTQCGYNLAGNTSGACPECGEPAPLG